MSELPKPGEVWGMPDKPYSWNVIRSVDGDMLKRFAFGISGELPMLVANMPTDYVRIFPKDTP